MGVEASLTKKQEQRSEGELEAVRAEVAQISSQLNALLAQIRQVRERRDARLEAYKTAAPAQRVNEINLELIQNSSEQAAATSQREETNRQIRSIRARARTIREAIAFKLHFTGIEVGVCPNCDAEVDTVAVEREEAFHTCRLCSKPAASISVTEMEEMEATVADHDQRIVELERLRVSFATQLQGLREAEQVLCSEANLLREVAEMGIEVAVVTQEEDEHLAKLYEHLGQLRAELGAAQKRIDARSSESGNADIRVKVVEKIRDVLKEEAQKLNENVLKELSIRTGEMANRIGAESISDVACSPLGIVTLHKHDVPVRFTGIQNPGERLRVKLAFFLAMMHISRVSGAGRHPGLLLIDQLGSAEMVEADCQALASILHKIDMDLSACVQILCFSARLEFRSATVPTKVYGPQSDRYAF